MATLLFENAFLASPRVLNLGYFQHVLLTSFQVCFLSDFWSHLRLHLAPFLRKNHSENRFKQIGPPKWKSLPIPVSDGSQRRRLACALLNSNNCSSSNCCSNSNSSSNCCSNSCPNGCLSWLQLQLFQKQFEKMERADIKTQCWWSDTLVGQGPGELNYSSMARHEVYVNLIWLRLLVISWTLDQKHISST